MSNHLARLKGILQEFREKETCTSKSKHRKSSECEQQSNLLWQAMCLEDILQETQHSHGRGFGIL